MIAVRGAGPAAVALMILAFPPYLYALTVTLSPDPPALTLPEAFRLAVNHNERTQVSVEAVAIALQNIRLARAAVLPTLSTSLAQSRNKQAGSGGFVSFRNNRDVRIDLVQPLYGGGKEWAVLRGAKLEESISHENVALVHLAVRFEAAIEFFSMLRAQEKLEIVRKALDLAERQLALAQARRTAGTAIRTEVIRSEVTVSAARRDQVRAHTDVEIARARLAFVLGRPVEGKVSPAAESPRRLRDGMPMLVQKALRRRPDYRIAELQVALAEEDIRIARAAYMPSAKLNGSVTQTQHVSSFRDRNNWQIQASVGYDLFEGMGRDAVYEQARRRHRQAVLEQSQLTREIERDIRESLLEIDAFTTIREATHKEIAAARENYDRVFAQFGEGLSTAVDLADAQTTLVAAEVQRSTVEADLLLAQQKLELSTGTLGEGKDTK